MWELSFITKEDLVIHVKETIKKYGDKLDSFDVKKFNANIIDPIKLTFDKNVYQVTWDEIIKDEVFRQRDKSNNNDIGYFHQNIFQYIKGCNVPEEGWDIVFSNNGKIDVDDQKVSKVFIELKNKHNTMNSASSGKTYMKMQNQLLNDDDCACFLVEVIAKKSQNIKWATTVDKKKLNHKLIRRVSIDKFYELITGDANSFYKLCKILPEIVEEVVREAEDLRVPKDTVYSEIYDKSIENGISFTLSLFLLGFSTYEGFNSIVNVGNLDE